MMYNKDDVYIFLNTTQQSVKERLHASRGELYHSADRLLRLTLPEDQLFESEISCEKSRQQIKLNSADVQNDFISVKPDPFDNWIGR